MTIVTDILYTGIRGENADDRSYYTVEPTTGSGIFIFNLFERDTRVRTSRSNKILLS